MILEKIREHSVKIMFFSMNILLVAVGVLFIRQKGVEKINAAILEADAKNYKSAADYALDAQKRIVTDKEIKINSIANNPDTVQGQKVVPVTRTIPAVTKTVTVQKPSGGTSSTSSSAAKTTTPAKTTTKTS